MLTKFFQPWRGASAHLTLSTGHFPVRVRFYGALAGTRFFSFFLTVISFAQKIYKKPPTLIRRRFRQAASTPPIVNYCARWHQLVLSCPHQAFPVSELVRPLTGLEQKTAFLGGFFRLQFFSSTRHGSTAINGPDPIR